MELAEALEENLLGILTLKPTPADREHAHLIAGYLTQPGGLVNLFVQYVHQLPPCRGKRWTTRRGIQRWAPCGRCSLCQIRAAFRDYGLAQEVDAA